MRILHEVDFGQHHAGLGAALPGGGQIALQAPRVEVLERARHHQQHVDVGGDHLGGGDRAPARGIGHGAGEGPAPGEHGLDHPRPVAEPDPDPVADGGEAARNVAQTPGGLSDDLAVRGDHHEPAAVLGADAGGRKVHGFEGGEGVCEPGGPPERGKVMGRQGGSSGRRKTDGGSRRCAA